MADDEQAVLDFCSITGADPETAKSYLSAADWNADIAVGLYLENEPKEHLAPASSSSGGAARLNSSHKTSAPREEQIRAPIKPKRAVLTAGDSDEEYGLPLHNYVDANASSGFSNRATSFMPPIEPFRNFAADSPFAATGALATSNSPEDARRRRLAELFRPPTELMFAGGFEAARAHSTTASRYLLVTVHEPTIFACQVMNRDLWRNETVREFISESLVFLQLAAGTGEAEKYQRFYDFGNQYPHVALIDPRTGERVKMWSTQLGPDEFMQEVCDYASEHPLERITGQKRPSPIPIFEDASEGEDEDGQDQVDHIANTSLLKEQRMDSPNAKYMDIEVKEEPSIDTTNCTTIQFRLPGFRGLLIGC